MNRWKWTGLVLVFLFVVYCGVGFFVAPGQLKKQLVAQAKEQAGVDLSVGQVKVNPLALSVTLEKLDAKDSNARDLIAAEKIYVNLQLWPLLKKTIALRQLTLGQPDVNLILTADGEPHWMDSIPPSSGDTEPQESDSAPWVFQIAQTDVVDGVVRYADQPHPEAYETRIGGLNFSLAGLTTQAGEPAPVSMVFAHEGQGEVSLAGGFALNPLVFDGQLNVSDLQLQPSWRYARYLHGISLASGTLNGALNIKLNGADGLDVVTSDGSWALTDTDMTLADGTSLLTLAQLDVLGPVLSLSQRSIVIPQISLSDGRLRLLRDSQGQLDLPQSLLGDEPAAAAQGATEPAAAEVSSRSSAGADSSPPVDPAFTVLIENFEVQQFPIEWTDQAVEPAVSQTLTINSLSVTNFDLNPATQFPLTLEAALDQGTIKWQGTHGLTPLSAEGALELSALPLPWLTSYVRQSAAIDLAQGDLAGSLNVAVTETVSVEGGLSINSLDTQGAEGPLASFTQLSVSGLDLQIRPDQPARLVFQSVELKEPALTFAIAEDASSNLSRLARSSAVDSQDSSENSGQPEDEQVLAPQVALEVFTIQGGRLTFSDASVEPDFTANITDFGGTLKGLNSQVDSPATVEFAGRLEGYADIGITGELNPLEDRSKITLSTKNIDLTSANAYAGKFVGRLIQRGRLDLDLGYELDGNSLKGNNKVTLGQLTLGSQVNSEDAVSLPLDLALALLKDPSGNIDLGVPVAGQLDDPQFRVGSVIFKAFVNLIVKAVASPFFIIGKLIPGGGEDLQYVGFAPGVEQLDDAGRERLGLLAEALLQRPNLRLDIAGVSSRALDVPALQRSQLNIQLGLGTMDEDARSVALTQAFEQQIGPLPVLPTSGDAEVEGASTEAETDMQAVLQGLLDAQVVSDDVLLTLAGARAAAIKRALSEVDEALTERAYVLESRLVELSGGEEVVVELVLAAGG
ncbi:MAG: DUF748 domain-containing protein [Lysobacterales bacterium]